MNALAINPAEISPIIKQHLKLLENRFNTVKGSLEMLTIFEYPNLKSAECMLVDCLNLLTSAIELQQAMSNSSVYIDYNRGSIQIKAQATMDEYLGGFDQSSSVSETPEADNSVRKARGLISRKLRKRGRYIASQEPDWHEVLRVYNSNAYQGMNVDIDGEQITIKTFKEYCENVIGLSDRQVQNYLKIILNLGSIEDFQMLRKCGLTQAGLHSVCKLPAEQKQALLQIARTGDKAATLAFIQQALPAGE